MSSAGEQEPLDAGSLNQLIRVKPGIESIFLKRDNPGLVLKGVILGKAFVYVPDAARDRWASWKKIKEQVLLFD